jgi:hypothetical protein
MFVDARCKFFILVSLLYVSSASSPAAVAQDPIRVQTREVLVPVTVYNKDRLELPTNFRKAYLRGEMQTVDKIVEGFVIRNLTASDFQVFEDGVKQTVQDVSYEPSLYWNVRDNRGNHTEYFGLGGGKWSTAEWPPNMFGDIEPPHYLIAYALPDSPEGSCHQIKVNVNRSNAWVFARGEYCNSKHSASDALSGTALAKQLENDLATRENNKIDVSLLAVPFYTNGDAARVHVALDWSWTSLKRESQTKGVLGIIFKKDGSLVTRFSDTDRDGFSTRPESPISHSYGPGARGTEDRYETQVRLPPGEYDLRVVLGDGKRFGRAEVPLTVGSYDSKDLAISTISLCKQIDDVFAYSPGHAPTLPGVWRAKLPGNYMPLVSKDIEFKPTANTRFKKGETLYTYFEVYEPFLVGQTPATVQVQMRVVDLKTGELESDSQFISATPYVKAGSPVIPIGRGIDISKLPKGSYRLDVQATDSAGKSTPWRTANFTVE